MIDPILDGEPLDLHIKGLEIMNDDPAEVDVIYAKVVNPKLQELADSLTDPFLAAGLMTKQYDRVKLHMTVMNTKFRNKLEDEFAGYKEGPRIKMDARSVLSEFKDYDFGHVQLETIHLSQRRAGRRTEENYYYPSAIIQL